MGGKWVQAWEESVCVGGCVGVCTCACLFLFAMETAEFGAFSYKSSLPSPVRMWTGCDRKPAAFTKIAGSQGGQWHERKDPRI